MSVSQTEKMTIYVQSRGLPSRYDYQWQSEKQAPLIDLPPLQIPGISTAELNSFCLILCRSNDSLYLLACGLLSGRKDINHRNIRNTVMWKIDRPDDRDEARLRTLAAMILRNEKIQLDSITRSIESSEDDKYGYSVNWSLLDPTQLLNSEPLAKIGSDLLLSEKLDYSSKNIDDITTKLLNYSLPTGERNLVIIKDDKSQLVIAENKSCLIVGNILHQLLTVEQKESDLNPLNVIQSLFDLLKDKLPPKFVLFAIGLIATSGMAYGSFSWSGESQPSPHVNVTNVTTTTPYIGNKPGKSTYTLTGDSNMVGATRIAQVKLIDSDNKVVATSHKLNDNSADWEIIYKPEVKIDCQRKLSIQGFGENGKIGDKVALLSLCND